ncbi:MAG: 50S ribosomal protein L14e [Nanoarchaeota archaeon]
MIGRVIVKLSGKEAGRYGIIVDQLNENYVLIDGNLKRRRSNLIHLELTEQVLDIKKGAPTSEVREAMKKARLKVTSPRAKVEKEVKEKTNGKGKK